MVFFRECDERDVFRETSTRITDGTRPLDCFRKRVFSKSPSYLPTQIVEETD